ncbi:DNA/RNA non-specific endonuclease [Streptomyces sp. NPDC057582]|uniref:DNA/RNA non-specific endonuclease n=1 Tax=Streptomyces sp. NPDC057582 TaxID=3346174 RepID=UPI00367D2CEA
MAAVVAAAVTTVVKDTVEKIEDAVEDAAEEEPEPKPSPKPRGTGDDDDDDSSCGWVQHGAQDAANGNRATSVSACLDKDYLATHKGSSTDVKTVAPPGYQWAQRVAGHLGVDPSKNINACHLLGNQLSGSGTDLNNLANCARGANDWQNGSDQGSNNMKNYENQVAEAVNAGGQEVMYSVTAHYTGNRTVPNGFTLTAYGTNPDGTPGIRIDEFIPNTLKGNNLGMYNHHTTGAPIPTGSMP